MQNIQYLKDQNAVLVPLEQWEKVQKELATLKKRLRKAVILTEFRDSLKELKEDLKSKKYKVKNEVDVEDFLEDLRNEQ